MAHLGTFGWWRNCKCGKAFNDCTDAPTEWEKHKEEHGV